MSSTGVRVAGPPKVSATAPVSDVMAVFAVIGWHLPSSPLGSGQLCVRQ